MMQKYFFLLKKENTDCKYSEIQQACEKQEESSVTLKVDEQMLQAIRVFNTKYA